MKLLLLAATLVALSIISYQIIVRCFLKEVCTFGSPETSALGSLREIHNAQAKYQESHDHFGTLQELADSGLIDPRYALKHPITGYVFSTERAGTDGYCVSAKPVNKNQSARYFSITEEGEFRYLESENYQGEACVSGKSISSMPKIE